LDDFLDGECHILDSLLGEFEPIVECLITLALLEVDCVCLKYLWGCGTNRLGGSDKSVILLSGGSSC
jgi:hypothetical protein